MQFENPYSPPAGMEVSTTPVPREDLKIAGRGKRLLNLLLDQIILFAIAVVVYFMLYAAMLLMWDENANEIAYGLAPLFETLNELLPYLIVLGYYVLFETFTQRTPAKFITGTYVVGFDGRKPTIGQIVGRTLARIIPFEFFSYLRNSNPIGLHDAISKTKVVEV